MEFEKVSETEVKIINQVEEIKSLDELNTRELMLKNSINTLQAEIKIVNEQIKEAGKLGIKMASEVKNIVE